MKIVLTVLLLVVACSRTERETSNVEQSDVIRVDHSIRSGIPVSSGTYPSVGAVFRIVNNQIVGLCSGTLISSSVVLTAAHCVSSELPNQQGAVALPPAEVAFSFDSASPFTVYRASAISIHPQYTNGRPFYAGYDVALVKLVVTFTGIPTVGFFLPWWIGPSQFVPNPVQLMTAMGYGANSTDGSGQNSGSGVRRIGAVYFGGLEPVCSAGFGVSTCTNPATRLDNALIRTEAGPTNQIACGGDSGGPLLYEYGGLPYLMGFTSFGYGEECINASGARYTSIAPLIPWINTALADISNLVGATPDRYEINDTREIATDLSAVTEALGFDALLNNLSIHVFGNSGALNDVDWFSLSLPGTGTPAESVTLTIPSATSTQRIQVSVVTPAGAVVATMDTGTTGIATYNLKDLVETGYLLKIFALQGAIPNYTLDVKREDYFERPIDNNTRANATNLSAVVAGYNGLVHKDGSWMVAEHLNILGAADEDWFAYPLSNAGGSGDKVNLKIPAMYAGASGTLTVKTYFGNDTVAQREDTVLNNATETEISLKNKPAGTYYFQVSRNGYAVPSYTLKWGAVGIWDLLFLTMLMPLAMGSSRKKGRK